MAHLIAQNTASQISAITPAATESRCHTESRNSDIVICAGGWLWPA